MRDSNRAARAAVANSDSLVVTFTGIPDGVMVMVPAMVAVGMIPDPAPDAASPMTEP